MCIGARTTSCVPRLSEPRGPLEAGPSNGCYGVGYEPP